MRRFSLALLAAVLFVGFHGTSHVFAITYGAGWNLVAGPEGSRLSGASGSVFTMQPGDTDYESFPADSPLHGGWGYWANFPSGGGITLNPGLSNYSVASVPEQFIMIGNPSQSVVTISGADIAYTYTPRGGYQASTAIPPGQGAWVMGGQIDLAGSGSVAAPSSSDALSAPISAQAGAAPQTSSGLKAFALNQGDLPGYSLQGENPTALPGVVATYFGSWIPTQRSSPVLIIIDSLSTTPTIQFASGLVNGFISDTRGSARASNIRALAPIAVGDEESAIGYTWTSASGHAYDDYEIRFRRGVVIVDIDMTSATGTGTATSVINYALIIDQRLTGGASGAPVASVAVVAQPAGHLLEYSGTGNGDTPSFTLPTAGANVCVQVSGQSPSGILGPSLSAVFFRTTGKINSFPTDFDNGGCKILHPDDGAGSYYLEMIATPWTRWTVTVDAQ